MHAYLGLRQRAPHLLCHTSDWQLVRLFDRVSNAGHSGILRLLIADLLGDDFLAGGAPQHDGGLFGAAAGTQRRATGLRALMLAESRIPSLRLGEASLRAFKLLLSDCRALRSSGPEQDDGGTDGEALVVPDNFPLGEAHRLVRTVLDVGYGDDVPILQALQGFLAERTHDFPTPHEGSSLIGFYLSEPVQDPLAALGVVRMMRETDAIGHDALLQAQEDGQAWLAHAQERLLGHSDNVEAAPEELRRTALEITLRIVGLRAATTHRPMSELQVRRALEALMGTLRSAPGDRAGRSFGSPTAIASRHLRASLFLVLAQPGVDAIHSACSMLQRCDRHVLAMLEGDDFERFCEAAISADRPDLAASGFMTVLKARSTVQRADRWLGPLVSPRTLLAMLRVLAKGTKGRPSQPTVVNGLLRGLGLLPLTPDSVARWDQMYANEDRIEVISMLADADLRDPALTLFQRWARIQFPKAGTGLLSRRTQRFFKLHRQASRLSRYETSPEAIEASAVACSNRCMIDLVLMLTRDEVFKEASRADSEDPAVRARAEDAQRQLDVARMVVEAFKISKETTGSWSHSDMTSLAKAHFRLRDAQSAFDALSALVHARRLPDAVDIAVLLTGLMELDPDRAFQLLTTHAGDGPPSSQVSTQLKRLEMEREAAASGGQDMAEAQGKETQGGTQSFMPATFRPTSNIIAQLVSAASRQKRFDLVRRLLRFADAHKMLEGVTLRSWKALMSLDAMAPRDMVRKLQSLVRAGFRPDGAFLDNVARECMRSSKIVLQAQSPRTSSSAGSAPDPAHQLKLQSAKERGLGLDAALRVVQLCYKELGVVNFATVGRLLKGMRAEARRIFPTATDAIRTGAWTPSRRNELAGEWVARLDRLVAALRWTPLFDRGGDLRLGLPLWKSTSGRDGKLTMYNVSDMIDAAKREQDGFRKYSRRRRQVSESTVGDDLGSSSSSSDANLDSSATEGSDSSSRDSDSAPVGGQAVEVVDEDPVPVRRPNVLPLGVFRDLMQTYISLGDYEGAAEVAAWMRDEAQADVAATIEEQDTFVEHIRELLRNGSGCAAEERAKAQRQQRSVLEMLAGKREVARKKSWWNNDQAH
ncbi:uncharacterized protein PSFLO_05241 [Pseudozyma flocculosa]|uniref:Uncharacterized protein n=2 Tax=Pseudozyma flocculosa TaxID=84751 RepID=A0A5C3F6I2_9BASI|nr:uncharacterized protein PSFLO_05241 [Pseudozyma flocculosa]